MKHELNQILYIQVHKTAFIVIEIEVTFVYLNRYVVSNSSVKWYIRRVRWIRGVRVLSSISAETWGITCLELEPSSNFRLFWQLCGFICGPSTWSLHRGLILISPRCICLCLVVIIDVMRVRVMDIIWEPKKRVPHTALRALLYSVIRSPFARHLVLAFWP